jgi:orotate phosphoribosyltransferase
MTKKELAKEIYNCSHLTGTFLLRSGKISNEYFDKYRFESNPKLLSDIANQLVLLLPSKFDILAGLEMGGIPIATALSIITGVPAAFIRKKAKEYGTKRISEGADVKDKRIVIVEDVITSGEQVILSSKDLVTEGAIIDRAICVIDRQSGGKEALAEAGIELFSLFTMGELKGAVSINI